MEVGMGRARLWQKFGLIGLELVLAGCWPASETYFTADSPDGKTISSPCGTHGKQVQIRSAAYNWIVIEVWPHSLPSSDLIFTLTIDEDWRVPNERRTKHIVDMKINLTGSISADGSDGKHQDIPVAMNDSQMTRDKRFLRDNFWVQGFHGDDTTITLPSIVIDGVQQTLPPIHFRKVTNVTIHGINGC